jgi:CRISPR-associated protein Cmr2
MNHLLQINLGPVQGFIATARRSRDLWFGSYILSELSKSVALALHNSQARLIFPYVDKLDQQLAPDSDFLVTNIVFAELDTLDINTARLVLEDARQAAQNRWKNLCNIAIQQIEKAHEKGQDMAEQLYDIHIWRSQLDDVLEIYSAVVSVGPQGYAHANNQLRELLGNRKNTRNFTPYVDNFKRPKSSLDGAQSSVLKVNPHNGTHRLRLRLGIEHAEQLDTSAMVKRVIGRERGFIPTARIASQDWIEKISAHPTYPALSHQLSQLARMDIGNALGGRYAEYSWIKTLPFDGQFLYRYRVQAEQNRMQEETWGDDLKVAQAALGELDKLLAQIYSDCRASPQPYYGLLLADGDKMGQLIDRANEKATNGDGHRAISAALSAFAQSVPDLMNKHQGACIYSGGDDVLGLVPLHNIFNVSNDLRQAFKKQLNDVAAHHDLAENERPTLSVGIALVHFLHPLGDARQLASRAEKLAKGSKLPLNEQRNAMCLWAQPRSGNAMHVRIRWDDDVAMQRLQRWTQQLRISELPRGLPHELKSTYDHCCEVIPPDDTLSFDSFKAYWRAQLSAILNKKKSQGQDLSARVKAELLAQLCDQTLSLQNAKNFTPLEHLLMTRWLSGLTPQDDQ